MKQFMATILAFLSLKAFAQDKDGKSVLTEEQQIKLNAEFGDEFTVKFVEALSKDPDGKSTDNATMVAMVNALAAKLQASAIETSNLQAQKQKAESDLVAEKAEKDRLAGVVSQKDGIIATLTKKPEDDPASNTTGMTTDPKKSWVPSGKDTHLFGQSQSLFALDDAHPYNKRAYAAMARRHGLDVMAPLAASSLDYSSLKTDLGEYYRIRMQDRIQSFLTELPDLEKIFPTESGYQDQAVLVNMFLLDDFSQADGTIVGGTFSNLVKGSFKFEPEVLTMYDVMFVHQFSQLKELEKNWLGFLNREGSSTMKWSFIQYVLVETAKKLKNEKSIRTIRGVRKNPTINVPGTSLQAANGILKFIKNQIAAFKVKPFALGEWTPSTIAAYIKDATKLIPEVLRDSGRIVLYMSTDALDRRASCRERVSSPV